MAGHPGITAGLALAAGCVWVVLNYWLPWSIVARAHRPVLREFNGTWFIWVVGTQSLAIAAIGLVGASHAEGLRRHLAEAAVCLWGVGIVLYLVLVVIILLRLMVVEVTPAEMGPAYWIAMGATAISVRAAAGILGLPGSIGGFPVGELHAFVLGTSVVLWSFGTWWIPLLVLFGLWRHVLRRYPLGDEPGPGSMVFPVGRDAVASSSLGGEWAANGPHRVAVAAERRPAVGRPRPAPSWPRPGPTGEGGATLCRSGRRHVGLGEAAPDAVPLGGDAPARRTHQVRPAGGVAARAIRGTVFFGLVDHVASPRVASGGNTERGLAAHDQPAPGTVGILGHQPFHLHTPEALGEALCQAQVQLADRPWIGVRHLSEWAPPEDEVHPPSPLPPGRAAGPGPCQRWRTARTGGPHPGPREASRSLG